MSPLARRLLTNFTKGELSPLMEGRPDIEHYFEGCSRLVNFNVLRQGGATKRVGTIFVKEVKTSSLDTILISFIRSESIAYIVELGNTYARFYRDHARIEVSAGSAYEIATPYTTAQLRDIHFTQSVDVQYQAHPDVAPRKLISLGDTSWTIGQVAFNSPATFEADTDISGGTATLTPGATTGTAVTFTASSGVFMLGDVGRVIIYGASSAVIVGFTSATIVTADIIDAFPDTNPIAAGSWLLRGTVQAELTSPAIRKGLIYDVTLDKDGFRAADVGKYIVVLGGMMKILAVKSATTATTIIVSELGLWDDSVAGSAVAAAGTWFMEVVAWTATYGYPRTVEFIQGRLGYGGNATLPTTFWLSRSGDFENFAPGVSASDAIRYRMSARQLTTIQWLSEASDMFIGTSGGVLRAYGGREGEPLGGDIVPNVRSFSPEGSAHIQAIVLGQDVLFIDKLKRKMFIISFNIERDNFDVVEITGASEHIFNTGVRLGHMAVTLRPDPRVYIVTENGELVTLTYFRQDKVVGFSRYISTNGLFESVAAIPGSSGWDEVWVIVKRIIQGETKRYVEYFDLRDIEG